jgi:hypothetical protein
MQPDRQCSQRLDNHLCVMQSVEDGVLTLGHDPRKEDGVQGIPETDPSQNPTSQVGKRVVLLTIGDCGCHSNCQPDEGDRYSHLECGVGIPPRNTAITVVATHAVFTVTSERLPQTLACLGVELRCRNFDLETDGQTGPSTAQLADAVVDPGFETTERRQGIRLGRSEHVVEVPQLQMDQFGFAHTTFYLKVTLRPLLIEDGQSRPFRCGATAAIGTVGGDQLSSPLRSAEK